MVSLTLLFLFAALRGVAATGRSASILNGPAASVSALNSTASAGVLNGTSSAGVLNGTVSAGAPNSTAVPSTSAGVNSSTSYPTTTAQNSTTAKPGTTTATTATTTKPANSSTTSAPAPTSTVSLDSDLATLAPRRIDFVIAQQSGAKDIPAWLSTLGADGKWPDSEVDYTTGCPARRANWPAQEHWQRLGALAAAWHGGFRGADPKFVQDSTLRSQIGAGMDWWFERDFTVLDCLDNGGTDACPCSTPGLWNTNWFSNVILIPRLVGQTCLLLNTTLTPTQLANCTHMTARTYSTFFRTEPPSWLVGANLLDIASVGIAGAVLTGNDTTVADAYSRVHKEVTVQTGFQVDGILTDGSFGQHSGLLYNGNYGKDYSNDVLELEIEAGGTRFAAEGASKSAFESLMEASQWMIYQNVITGVLHWDFSTEGRFISFPVIDSQATGSLNINLTEVQELSTLWDSDVLQEVYDGLTKNTSTANVGGLVGNRMFWNNDYMVTRGKDYVSTVKMYSKRTRNAECTNTQNPVGFHLADGTTYTYIKGDEYEDISVAWDWNLIPGITIDYGGTPLTCETENHAGLESFVGGVSNGKIGAAVMRYTNPITRAFSFQKAWFHFAKDLQHVTVSILAANSTTPAPVVSVLDQRAHRGTIYVDNKPVTSGNFSTPHTLFHADTGYLFHSAPALSIDAGPRTGNWSAIGTSEQPPATVDLFAAWIPHGTDLGSAVSYTVFPARKRLAFAAEAALNPLHTLSADTKVAAVQDRLYSTTMIAFWQAGGGAVPVPGTLLAPAVTIRVDNACVVILDLHAWTVALADPTQALTTLRLTVEVHGLVRPRGWGNDRQKSFDVVLPGGGMAGSTVVVKLLG